MKKICMGDRIMTVRLLTYGARMYRKKAPLLRFVFFLISPCVVLIQVVCFTIDRALLQQRNVPVIAALLMLTKSFVTLPEGNFINDF